MCWENSIRVWFNTRVLGGAKTGLDCCKFLQQPRLHIPPESSGNKDIRDVRNFWAVMMPMFCFVSETVYLKVDLALKKVSLLIKKKHSAAPSLLYPSYTSTLWRFICLILPIYKSTFQGATVTFSSFFLLAITFL